MGVCADIDRGANRRKKPKTLSGIETSAASFLPPKTNNAGKNLKPYQGLKRVRSH